MIKKKRMEKEKEKKILNKFKSRTGMKKADGMRGKEMMTKERSDIKV